VLELLLQHAQVVGQVLGGGIHANLDLEHF
jgi:hypothetical protein